MEQELENRNIKKLGHREKKGSRNERIIRQLCNQSQWNNIHITGVSKEEEEKRRKCSFEEILKTFPV